MNGAQRRGNFLIVGVTTRDIPKHSQLHASCITCGMKNANSFRDLKVWQDAMTVFVSERTVLPVMMRVAEVGRMLNGLIASMQVD